ncbi:hypothetical protein DUNSADRAFT_16501 [Dunaliella salina]|uniref:Uncharacterized protein n=1 Tax=Dunaliella salina TaxID=3046 RepID=A0ABQ7G3F5_DUNSA|nr:hypothetical protein DUNSADRAFT_16501 [Dunaliella salina]|eukprot:KAF5829141.1 hypothetical protein DUNSADRAFT_16501 [Dunaliella salina]
MQQRRPLQLSAHAALRVLLRKEYFFFLAIFLSGTFMYAVSRLLKGAFDTSVMHLPTCEARFEALSMPYLKDEPSFLAERSLLTDGQMNQHILRRHSVYFAMSQDVQTKGLKVGGVITQGLSQSDLFEFKQDSSERRAGLRSLRGRGLNADQPSTLRIVPVLHELDVPVRAMILPIRDASVAAQILETVQKLVLPALPEGAIWLQDNRLYHATVFHASSHLHPVPASPEDVDAEARAISGVASTSCPIEAVLERLVVTSSGVVVACWQATLAGTEPAQLREALRRALPDAPPAEAQMVKEPAILHTTIARLLQPPGSSIDHERERMGASSGGEDGSAGGASASSRKLREGRQSDVVWDFSEGGVRTVRGEERDPQVDMKGLLFRPPDGFLRAAGGELDRGVDGQRGMNATAAAGAVAAASKALCGTRLLFSELWFVEELDLLALALRGRFVEHRMPLQCPKFH